MNDDARRRGSMVAAAGRSNINDDDDDDVAVPFHCSSATIFGLLTVDCTAQNISSVKQLLRQDRHHGVKLLRLADNRLARLDPDEFGLVVPHLQQLYLARNFIAAVDDHTFRNLRNLQVGVGGVTLHQSYLQWPKFIQDCYNYTVYRFVTRCYKFVELILRSII